MGQGPPTMHADEFLSAVRSAYASAAAYRDRGEVVCTADRPNGRMTTFWGKFRTFFVRDEAIFSFEFYRAEGGTFALRAENGQVLHCEPALRPPTGAVSCAVASLTGITYTAAHTVPRILLPNDVGGRDLTVADSARIVGQEIIAGERCFVVDLGEEWNGRVILASEGHLTVRRVTIPMTLPNNDGTLTTIPEIQFRMAPSVRAQIVLNYEPEIYAVKPADFAENEPT